MDNFTLKLLKYWRNCLADAEKADLKPEKLAASDEAIKVRRSEIAGGKVDAGQAKKLIDKAKIAKENKHYRKKNHRGEHSRDDEGKQDIQDVKVLVCPIFAIPIPEHGKGVFGRDEPIRPIWIPAKLDRDGQLGAVSDDLPWIPRILLEPVAINSETVGTLEAADEFLGTHPFPGNGSGVNWSDIWRYSDEMLQAVTGQTLEGFSRDGYKVLPFSYIVLDTLRGAAEAVIRFYDQLQREIEKGRPVPPLLKRYTSLEDTEPVQFLSEMEQTEKSAAHLGQMSPGFSLYPSQREALHHALMMEEGEIFAVNGPPGNGKTTLIQSVVATLWVEAALRGQEPPVIVATSTNNQAVTNIIDSFGKTGEEEDQSGLSGRWIPGITSYGLYCPAPSRQEREEAVEFQRSMKKEGERYAGFYLARGAGIGSSLNEDKNIEEQDFVNKAEKHFLECCSQYAKQDFPDLGSATAYLRESLVEFAGEIRKGPLTWIRLKKITDETISTYGSGGGIDEHISRLDQGLEQCQSEGLELKNVRKGWAEHTDRAPWWVHFMNFVPRWLDFIFRQARYSVAAYNKRYLSEIGWKVEGDLADPGTIEDFFDRMERGLEEIAQKLSADLRRAELDKSELEQAARDWEVWRAKNDLRAEPPKLLDLMDTKLRYKAFKLATHYWEGQWLIEMKERFDWDRKRSQELSKQKERWRRYAKLTPCVVVTLHKLEWFFNAYDSTAEDELAHIPLYEFIDLLIIDEAGQVSPDIAAANFALARKALVVGDTKQLKPVRKITPGIDRANMKKHGVALSEKEAKAIDEAGFSVSEPYDALIPGGNVMKIAQRASRYQKTEEFERGMFLVEHRRCVPEIIAYCNELAYKGRLIPQRKSDPDYPLPRMGYLHIPGKSRKIGSSWVNDAEAQAIARWIVKYRQRLESHPDYRNKPIGEIIAVITPFKAQELEIKKALRSQSGLEGITVGTVHVLQGAERPVILYSSVYSPGDNFYIMNHEVNMLNVAVSRAKDSFLVFGNMGIFNQKDAKRPSDILARHLFAKEANQMIDNEIISLQQEQQKVMFVSPSISEETPPRQSSSLIRLFISYAHRDEDLRLELNDHLSNLQRQQIIYDWHDRRIVPGQEWADQIDDALNEAQIILLLISARFMSSDYCYAKEMVRAVERHDAGESVVIPIILSACDWQGAPFSKLQALPKDAKPIKNWNDRDEAWLDVVRGLRRVIEML